jgi:hypothetical protein
MFTQIRPALLCFICLAVAMASEAQDSASLYNKIYTAPDKFFTSVERKSSWLETKLISATKKYLKKIQRRDRKIYKRLIKIDSASANELFNRDGTAKVDRSLSENTKPYIGHLDSTKTALNFLCQNNSIRLSGRVNEIFKKALSRYNSVHGLLAQTDNIGQQLQARQDQLKSRFLNTPLLKQYRKLQYDIYYYRAQVDEYKSAWQDPSRMERNLLEMVQQVPAFKEFFNKHSQLASQFQLPGSAITNFSIIPGLQTRDMVMQQMQSRFGTGATVQQYINTNITDAQSIAERLKARLNQPGAVNQALDMPDFKPNNQKTKTFFKRLEFGASVQSVRVSSVLPVSTNIALSAGYRISDKSVAGIGAGYRVGWKRNMIFTHEAIGARSFVDLRIKAGFWITGGMELNYSARFNDLPVFKDLDPWQKSAVIGISKKHPVGKKLTANIQLLYDFLHARQIPKSQPISFRVGYIMK